MAMAPAAIPAICLRGDLLIFSLPFASYLAHYLAQNARVCASARV
jgi:hypothetical protein